METQPNPEWSLENTPVKWKSEVVVVVYVGISQPWCINYYDKIQYVMFTVCWKHPEGTQCQLSRLSVSAAVARWQHRHGVDEPNEWRLFSHSSFTLLSGAVVRALNLWSPHRTTKFGVVTFVGDGRVSRGLDTPHLKGARSQCPHFWGISYLRAHGLT